MARIEARALRLENYNLPRLKMSMETQRPPENAGTAGWIRYFDNNWRKEGLSQDWYSLRSHSAKKVGFMMSKQMDLLKNPYDKTSLIDWAQKTKRDLEGFKLEFLSHEVVYPRKYYRNPNDPTRLEDPFYGHADIEDIVSDQERKGSVKKAVKRVKDFLFSAPDGSVAVITSPLGPTGFKTDDGLDIDYPDSYFFIMQKSGDEVMNYTLKTNFKLKECREAIEKLTGKKLTKESLVQDYVSAIATFRQGQNGIRSADDIIHILQHIQPEYAFVDDQNNHLTTWNEVLSAIDRGEKLYDFEKKTRIAIDEFVVYAQDGERSREDLQKAIAATILRMADIFFVQKDQSTGMISMEPNKIYKLYRSQNLSFGSILEKAAQRKGCSGGGDKSEITLIDSLATRLGSSGEDQYGSRNFNCPECGRTNVRPENQLLSACQHCGSSAVAC